MSTLWQMFDLKKKKREKKRKIQHVANVIPSCV